MKRPSATGLGEPGPEGKMALFQPPKEPKAKPEKPQISTAGDQSKPSERRIRTTIDLTSEALVILQQVQQEYRLKTGYAMPIWKALSLVITEYGSRKKSQEKHSC